MASVSFSGLASGIDTDALIKAMADSSRLATAPLKSKIEAGTKETSALEEFNTKLLSFSDSLKGFMTLAGGSVSKSGQSSDSDAVSVVVGSGARIGALSVTVSQLAKAAVFSFNDRFAQKDEPLTSTSGSVTITVGSGESQKVISADVDSTTTLSELADKLNQAAGDAASVSVVNAGTEEEPSYMLLVSGGETGAAKGTLQVSASESLTAAGLFVAGSLEQAQDAVFSVSGIGEVRRPSNQISDLLPGVTLNLKQENTGPVSISIANDAAKTAEKVGKMVELFNELVKYQKTNSKIERSEEDGVVTNIYSSLAHTRLDDEAVQSIKAVFSESFASLGEGSMVIADLGISTQRDGTYSFDQKKFEAAIAANASSVNSLMQTIADKLGSANGVISNYTRYQGQIDTAVDANKQEEESLNSRIERVEQSILKQSENLKKLYASFESRMSKLTSQGNSLMSILSSLSSK